jgi:pimeloyl-ACP methyl ester carboxylesterase
MSDITTPDSRAVLDGLERQAARYETPCGDGRMIWRLWDESGGKAPVVVLFHGGAGSWRHWVRNIPALAGSYRVLVPDLPGLGESDYPPQETAESITRILADGIDQIIGSDTSYDVVGFSFGATMSACVGALRGKRIRSVTIIGASGVAAAGATVQMEKVRHLEGDVRRETHRINLNRLMIADPAKIDDLALVIQDWNTVRSRLKTPPISRGGAVLRAIDAVVSPLNGIWGEFDPPANPHGAERAAAMKARRPEADTRLIPGAGHWVAYEAVDTVNKILLEMLARTRPAGV